MDETYLRKECVIYIVGNGELIQTWLDPWLPLHPPRPPCQITRDQTTNQRLSGLFLPNKTGWNERLIHEQVQLEDVPYVLATKISSNQNKDYLGWHYTETGIYTVKSGYWLVSHSPS